MLYCARGQWSLATGCFALASAFRSNGVTLAGFIIWGMLIEPLLTSRKVSPQRPDISTLLPFRVADHYQEHSIQCPPDRCGLPAVRMVSVLSLSHFLHCRNARAVVLQRAPADLRLRARKVLERGVPPVLDPPAAAELHHRRPSPRPAPSLLDTISTACTPPSTPHFSTPNIEERNKGGNTASSSIPVASYSPACHPRSRHHAHATLLSPYADRTPTCCLNAFYLLGRCMAARRASAMGQVLGLLERRLGRNVNHSVGYVPASRVTPWHIITPGRCKASIIYLWPSNCNIGKVDEKTIYNNR